MSDEAPALAPVLSLVQPTENPVDSNTVEMLEYFLDLARKGEITGVVIFAEGINNNFYTSYTYATTDYLKRLGAIEALKLKWYLAEQEHQKEHGK